MCLVMAVFVISPAFNELFDFFSRTPFHADVIRSFSWSANVCGKKRWLLVRAGADYYCYLSLAVVHHSDYETE